MKRTKKHAIRYFSANLLTGAFEEVFAESEIAASQMVYPRYPIVGNAGQVQWVSVPGTEFYGPIGGRQ